MGTGLWAVRSMKDLARLTMEEIDFLFALTNEETGYRYVTEEDLDGLSREDKKRFGSIIAALRAEMKAQDHDGLTIQIAQEAMRLLTDEDKERIRKSVSSGLSWQFSTYSWEDMIRDSIDENDFPEPKKLEEAREWAFKHLDYGIKEV